MRTAPATIVRWHRDLITRKREYASRRRPGRPSTGTSVKTLVIWMARENRVGRQNPAMQLVL
jgi:putative transposase